MKITRCDRCKAEILPNEPSKNVFEALVDAVKQLATYKFEYRIVKYRDEEAYKYYDLCDDCQKKLADWIGGDEFVERTKVEDYVIMKSSDLGFDKCWEVDNDKVN